MRTNVTVLQGARSHDLTVVAALKEELKIPARDKSKDARLLSLIRQATDRINAECGRPFGRERVSQTFWLDPCESANVLVLQRRPVVGAVVSVTEGETLIEATQYALRDAAQGLLARASSPWSWSGSSWTNGQIVVVYDGGYMLLNELPPALERACLDLAAYYYHTSGRDQTVTAINIPDVGSRNYASPVPDQTLPQSVRDHLRPYRKVA